MKLTDEQLGAVRRELIIHKDMNNAQAYDVWYRWMHGNFGYSLRFLEHELLKPDCHPYILQLVSEMVTDRITK